MALSKVTLYYSLTLLMDRMLTTPPGQNHTQPYPDRCPLMCVVFIPALHLILRVIFVL